MFGHLAPVPVDLAVTPREGGRVQLEVAGIKVRMPAEVAFELANNIVDAAEQAAQNKGQNK